MKARPVINLFVGSNQVSPKIIKAELIKSGLNPRYVDTKKK